MAKKSKASNTFNSKLKIVMKSGKYTLGYKSALKNLRSGKTKVLVLSSNLPPMKRSELEYLGMLSKTEVMFYSGTNNELGTACGKYFRVGVLSITDPGDSDILEKSSD